MKIRNIIFGFLGLFLGDASSPVKEEIIKPKLFECVGKVITFKIGAESSMEDRRAYADSSAWWARYGVLVRFDGVEYGQSLELVLSNNPPILEFEKYNQSNILALRIPATRKVLIVKNRVNNQKDLTGILNHEIGHVLGMKDTEDNPESLMFHFYEKPVKYLSYSDIAQFAKCR